MGLSVVLATYNEEENLATCLDSVKKLASEIVVVDGSSSDRTVEIAKKYGAKIKTTSNKPIFHINKQMAIDMATNDWILQLDADEQVSEKLLEEVKKKINSKNDFNGYWVPRKNYFLGRFLMKGGQYPDYTLRLYRSGKGRLPQKSVHEQAVVEGKVGYLVNPLLHYPYQHFSDYLLKWSRYVDLIADELQKDLNKKPLSAKIKAGVDFLMLKPVFWFIITYIRHKGFLDSWQGLVFSFFSALRFPVAYIRYLDFI